MVDFCQLVDQKVNNWTKVDLGKSVHFLVEWMWIWLKNPMFLNQIKHVNPRLKIQSIKVNQMILNQATNAPEPWILSQQLKPL